MVTLFGGVGFWTPSLDLVDLVDLYGGGYYIIRGKHYGIFTYIWVIFRADVGKYSIHGAYGHVKHGWFYSMV